MSGKPTPKPVTGKAAMVKVLQAAGEPLKTKELTERALKVKGVALKGKTLAATLAAILATENKKPAGLFIRTAPGTYGLRDRDKAMPKPRAKAAPTAEAAQASSLARVSVSAPIS